MIYVILWFCIGIAITLVWKWQWDFGHDEREEHIILGLLIIAWPITAIFVSLAFIGKLPEIVLTIWEAYQKQEVVDEDE